MKKQVRIEELVVIGENGTQTSIPLPNGGILVDEDLIGDIFETEEEQEEQTETDEAKDRGDSVEYV